MKDIDEAVEYVKHSSNPMPDPSEIEIRLLYEIAGSVEAITSEQADRGKLLREELGNPQIGALLPPLWQSHSVEGHVLNLATHADCGNAPKKLLVRDPDAAFALADVVSILDRFTDDVP